MRTMNADTFVGKGLESSTGAKNKGLTRQRKDQLINDMINDKGDMGVGTIGAGKEGTHKHTQTSDFNNGRRNSRNGSGRLR